MIEANDLREVGTDDNVIGIQKRTRTALLNLTRVLPGDPGVSTAVADEDVVLLVRESSAGL
jgi:hypothetical protein